MEKKKQTYEEAMRRLEVIVSSIDDGELDIDVIGENLKEAQALIKFCRDKLYRTDSEIRKLLEEHETIENDARKITAIWLLY